MRHIRIIRAAAPSRKVRVSLLLKLFAHRYCLSTTINGGDGRGSTTTCLLMFYFLDDSAYCDYYLCRTGTSRRINAKNSFYVKKFVAPVEQRIQLMLSHQFSENHTSSYRRDGSRLQFSRVHECAESVALIHP